MASRRRAKRTAKERDLMQRMRVVFVCIADLAHLKLVLLAKNWTAFALRNAGDRRGLWKLRPTLLCSTLLSAIAGRSRIR